MLNPNPYMALSNALGFSAADLNANRLGVLTPYQRKRLLDRRLQALGKPAAILALLIVSGIIFQVEFLIVVFLAACVITYMIATWQRFQEDLESHVEVVAGQWAPQQQSLPLGRYAAIMDGQTFNLSKSLLNAFNQNIRYQLYYTPGTRTILSAEII